MAESILTHQMKRHAIIVSLAARHNGSEIAVFLKVAQSFAYTIERESGAAKGDAAGILQRKRYC